MRRFVSELFNDVDMSPEVSESQRQRASRRPSSLDAVNLTACLSACLSACRPQAWTELSHRQLAVSEMLAAEEEDEDEDEEGASSSKHRD